MPSIDRDRNIVRHILKYCDEVNAAHEDFSCSKEKFMPWCAAAVHKIHIVRIFAKKRYKHTSHNQNAKQHKGKKRYFFSLHYMFFRTHFPSCAIYGFSLAFTSSAIVFAAIITTPVKRHSTISML